MICIDLQMHNVSISRMGEEGDMAEVRSFVADLRRRAKAYRVARGLTQAQMGELLGVSGGHVQSFESGRHWFGPEVIDRLMPLLRSGITLMADELRNAAEFLDSDASKEEKGNRIRALFAGAAGQRFDIGFGEKSGENGE